jgi:hypothetical protein
MSLRHLDCLDGYRRVFRPLRGCKSLCPLGANPCHIFIFSPAPLPQVLRIARHSLDVKRLAELVGEPSIARVKSKRLVAACEAMGTMGDDALGLSIVSVPALHRDAALVIGAGPATATVEARRER